MRVFYDRLTSTEDSELLTKEISQIVASNFNVKIEELLVLDDKVLPLNDLLFVDFITTKNSNDYSQIRDENLLLKFIQQSQEEYNQIHKNKINLIFFK